MLSLVSIIHVLPGTSTWPGTRGADPIGFETGLEQHVNKQRESVGVSTSVHDRKSAGIDD